ncbi:MAG: hypothetical protein IMF19_14445 [Proteobacteria bacterium]|nr:hypothetical protein [Pseudomonadota bacterium]
MNSGRAKKIAKALYEDLSRRGAKYFRVPGTGQIIRDELRRRYQGMKKLHRKNYDKAGK